MDPNLLPFRKPFKDKKALLRDLDETEAARLKFIGQAERLVDLWRRNAPATGLNLTLDTKAIAARIRWRCAQRVFGHQRFVVFLDPEIQDVCRRLEPDALRLLVGVEHRRLALNVRMALSGASLTVLQSYADETRALEDWLPEDLREPLLRRNGEEVELADRAR